MFACSLGDSALWFVQWLIDVKRVKPGMVDKVCGSTHSLVALLLFLLQVPSCCGQKGNNCISYAARGGAVDTIRYLVSCGLIAATLGCMNGKVLKLIEEWNPAYGRVPITAIPLPQQTHVLELLFEFGLYDTITVSCLMSF